MAAILPRAQYVKCLAITVHVDTLVITVRVFVYTNCKIRHACFQSPSSRRFCISFACKHTCQDYLGHDIVIQKDLMGYMYMQTKDFQQV